MSARKGKVVKVLVNWESKQKKGNELREKSERRDE